MKHFLRKALLLPILLLLSCCLFAQQRTVTGKIVDPDGKPIAGATVGIKGNNTITFTDENGAFSIVVPANESVLKISSATFSYQEIIVGTKSNFPITLQRDTKQLDDVVVIGYGTQRARNVTGSIVTVDPKKIEDLPVASLTEALRGQVPGLAVSGGSTRPGTMATLDIRQQFSFAKDGANNLPLIVIDDIVQTDPSTGLATLDRFNQLDMSEVESITVVRDASAAIYGARGSQGAILIKTKRGKAGPPKITYSGKFETNDAVSHSKVMNAKEFGIFSNRFNRANPSSNQNVFFTPTELAMMDTINYDWLGNDWNRAGAMQHSLTVSGGSERATYFTGGSYYTQGANLGSQDYSKWTFRAGTDVKVAGGFKLSATVSANNTSLEKSFTKVNITDGYASGGEQNDYAILLHMPKYIPWQYTIDGVPQWVSPTLGSFKPGSATGNNSLSNWNYFELLDNGSKTTSKVFNYNANFGLQYDVPFIKGLSVKGNYSIQSSSEVTEQSMQAMYLSQVNSNSNQSANPETYHLYTPTTLWKAPALNKSNSRVTYGNTVGTTEQINFFANYDRSFGDHSISAMFAGERGKNTYDYRYQIYDNPIPGAYNGTSVSAGTLNTGNSYTLKSENGSLSYLGRLSYNYRSKYLLQFVFRSDASSKVAPAHYWAFFPGVSAGWIVSDEKFFNVKWMNFLKVRVSMGTTGSDNIKPWKWIQTFKAETDKGMGFGSNGGNYVTGLTPEVTPNPNISWDRTFNRNVGLDMAFLKNRLTVTLDGYSNSMKNMLTVISGAINVPISIGGAFAEQNFAAVNFWGGEAAVNWSDHVGKFRYSIGVNFGTESNKVVTYFDSPYDYPSKMDAQTRVGASTIRAKWGFLTWKNTSSGDGMLRTDEDLDNYWAYLTDLATKAGTTPKYFGITTRAGMQKGMLAYQDLAGALDANTQTLAGPNGQILDDQDYAKLKNKNKSYGFTTNLNVGYKSLSLSAQISTSWGDYNSYDFVKQGTSSTNAMWSQVSYLNDMFDATDNPNGKIPNNYFYDYDYRPSDFWTLPSFRCFVRSMTISYTLPKGLLSKAHVDNARFFVSGYNLWDFYNPYPGKYRNMYDGINVNYPTLRTWALGVNLGF